MIVSFSVENFRSFRDLQVLGLEAKPLQAGHSGLVTNLARVGERFEVLKSKVIYGANASGKSNLLMAISFFNFAVTLSWNPESMVLPLAEPFATDPMTNKAPGFFELRLLAEGTLYRYGFMVSPGGGDRERVAIRNTGKERSSLFCPGAESSYHGSSVGGAAFGSFGRLVEYLDKPDPALCFSRQVPPILPKPRILSHKKLPPMTNDEMNELNRQLRSLTQAQNDAGNPDFAGLSPAQVHWLNSHPLEEGCVVRWQTKIPDAVLDQVPLLTFATDLMQRLKEKELKLTAKGNLPAKMVKEWYATGLVSQYDIEKGITKISSEDDVYFATTLKIVLDLLGWTKKRNGKLSLTAKGKKVLAGPRQKMLEQLFAKHFTNFNLGYFDGYEDDGALQHLFGFVLVLLLKNGEDWKPTAFYGDAMLQAFPMLKESFEPSNYSPPENQVKRAFSTRFLNRSLNFYGLLRFRGDQHMLKDKREMMATDLCRSLLLFDPQAQRPEQPGDADTQIRSALFDAEMGSSSWTSNDMPPEMQALFQDQIRAFHADGPTGRVTIASLLSDLNLPDPDSLPDEAAAVNEIEKLLLALQAKHVFFNPPHHLPPSRLYRFLITDFLAHEIPPPNPMMPAFVPLEAINPELAIPPATVLAAEAFLMALLTLEEPLPEDLFHHTMRLHGEVAPRSQALAHANAWRGQWAAIRPLSFAPGPIQEADGFTYQFAQLAFETTDHQGQTRTAEWTGVVQLIRVGEEWFTYGGSFQEDGGDGFGF